MNIQAELRNGMTIDEACRKYKLSFIDLIHMTKQPKQHSSTNYQYIIKQSSRYLIQKSVNGKHENFGSYFNLAEAIQVRDELIKLDWNVDKNDYIGDMYIYKTHDNGFKVAKSYGKRKTETFGIYECLSDARKVRDCLISMDWDRDYLPLILNILEVVKRGS